LATREGQQAMRQCGGALRRPLGRYNVTFGIAIAALKQARCDQLQTSRDALQQIVEIVREAAGKLSNRFHFLRLTKRFFSVNQF